jgi:hypothetical protein
MGRRHENTLPPLPADRFGAREHGRRGSSARAGENGILIPQQGRCTSAPGNGQPPAETAGEPGTIEARRRSWAFALESRSWITVRGLRLFAASIRTDNSSATRTSTVAPASNILLDALQGQYLTHFTDCSGTTRCSGFQIRHHLERIEHHAAKQHPSLLRRIGCLVLGQRNRVLNNVISDMNYSVSEAGALNLGKPYDTPGGPQMSIDHEIANNTIYRTPQQGINFRGLKNSANSLTNIPARIHHNAIHDVMMRSYDSAAIDTFGTNHQFVRIDHNLFSTSSSDELRHLLRLRLGRRDRSQPRLRCRAAD